MNLLPTVLLSSRAPTVLLLAAFALTPAARAELGTQLQLTRDSNDFSERLASVAWKGAAGLGVRTGVAQYQAPGWSRSGQLLLGSYELRQGADQLQASAGLVELAGHTQAIGQLDHMRRLSPSTGLGLSLERSYVNSQLGVESGVTFNLAALVLEHQLAPRLELGASLGAMHFSNDNTRTQLRSRWSYELGEDSGRYAYLKTRHYQNSRPGRPEYFSPEHLSELSLGLALKERLSPGVVLAMEGDYGRQDTESAGRPIGSLAVALSAPRTARLQWRVGLQWSNAASSATAGTHYRYSSLTAQLSVPM